MTVIGSTLTVLIALIIVRILAAWLRLLALRVVTPGLSPLPLWLVWSLFALRLGGVTFSARVRAAVLGSCTAHGAWTSDAASLVLVVCSAFVSDLTLGDLGLGLHQISIGTRWGRIRG
jgi:hypothetical protein